MEGISEMCFAGIMLILLGIGVIAVCFLIVVVLTLFQNSKLHLYFNALAFPVGTSVLALFIFHGVLAPFHLPCETLEMVEGGLLIAIFLSILGSLAWLIRTGKSRNEATKLASQIERIGEI